MLRTLLTLALLAALAACTNPFTSTSATPAQSSPAAQPAAPVSAPARAATAASAPAPAPNDTIATQDTNVSGIAADFTECKRKDGVLSVKIRLRNRTAAQVTVGIFHDRNYDSYYFTAANKKYFMLKDSEGSYLTPATDGIGGLNAYVAANGEYTWWAKFPAPPAEVKKITFMSPLAPPFEDVPVTDQ